MRKFSAYIDDYDKVVIENIDESYNREPFILWDEVSFSPLNHLKTQIDDDGVKITFKSETKIEVGKRYYCYSHLGEEALLEYRNIVRTKQFDDEFYYDGPLGNIYTKQSTKFYIWAPTAYNLIVTLFKPNSNIISCTHNMKKLDKGVWFLEIEKDLEMYSYQYYVRLNDKINIVTDPYANASRINNLATFIVDPNKLYEINSKRINKKINDAIIYETNIRDFSSDPNQTFSGSSFYNRFTEHNLTNKYGDKIGIDYIKELGVSHVQIMPIQFYGSIDELSRFKKYNWGYDTMQHNVPAGYYCSSPDDPYNRIMELKKLVDNLHKSSLGVVLDVVYNHVFDRDNFCMELILPGYFYRFDHMQNYCDGSGCGNDIASERKMVSRYIVDSVTRLAKIYNVDGFRFDLMGLLDIDTINKIRKELNALGPNIYMYGEGWNMETNLPYDKRAICENGKLTNKVGYFMGTYRDIVRGGHPNSNNLGLSNANHSKYSNLRNIILSGIDNSILEPAQHINFVSCHDNYTLYDFYNHNQSRDMIIHNVRNAHNLLLLSQGVPFIHSGSEFMRTKHMVENSYNADDTINMIDWNLRSENGFLVKYVAKLIKVRKKYKSLRLESRSQISKVSNIRVEGDVIFYTLNHIEQFDMLKSITIIINLGFSKYYLNNKTENWKCIMINETLDIDNTIKIGDFAVIEPASIAIFIEEEK